jgi:hypothetical protein
LCGEHIRELYIVCDYRYLVYGPKYRSSEILQIDYRKTETCNQRGFKDMHERKPLVLLYLGVTHTAISSAVQTREKRVSFVTPSATLT